mmetsp:Transcript_3610/g.6278  ORF Transcript_3610/g.6278 Transcript_3610/m.6278 type:complete len:81 (-) Transcript_3610:98-340(-)
MNQNRADTCGEGRRDEVSSLGSFEVLRPFDLSYLLYIGCVTGPADSTYSTFAVAIGGVASLVRKVRGRTMVIFRQAITVL